MGTGPGDRPEALLRALSETDVAGVATTSQHTLAVLAHPDFIAVRHSTTWLSDRVDLSGIAAAPNVAPTPQAQERKDIDVEVGGRHFAVSVWVPAPPEQLPAAKPAQSDSGGRGGHGGYVAGGAGGAGGAALGAGPGTNTGQVTRADARHDRESACQ